MLIEASGGVARMLNHLAARTLQVAAMANEERITGAHFQQGLESMPWLSASATVSQ